MCSKVKNYRTDIPCNGRGNKAISLRQYHVYLSPNKTRDIPTTVPCLFISKQNKRYPLDSIMFIHLQTKQEISLRVYHVYTSNKTRDIPTTVSRLFISKQNKRYRYDGITFIHLQTKQTNKQTEERDSYSNTHLRDVKKLWYDCIGLSFEHASLHCLACLFVFTQNASCNR